VAVKGDKDNHNMGFLCLKGFLLPQILYDPSRLTRPLIRKNGTLEEAGWDEALELVAERFTASVEQNGPDSVAFYGSGQAYTEESYVANKIWRAGFRTNNIEGNPRLCMASAVGGYVTTYGMDEPMGCYEDIDHADVFLLAGTNTAEAHPIIFQRIAKRKETSPDTKVIVLDPRRTPTARIADLHLQFKPGTDLAIMNAMAHVLLKEDLVDPSFMGDHVVFGEGGSADKNWNDYVRFLEEYTPERASEISGCPTDPIVQAARWFGDTSKRTMSLWTMGLNQRSRGVWANNLVHNLHLITGKIGIPGSTPFSLTGQPNACGGVRDQGGLSHLLPFGRLAGNPAHRAAMEKLWNLAPGTLPDRPGAHAVDMFRGLESGDIKGIYIMCTNPGQSFPNVNRYRAALERDDTFVVVSDIYPTLTTELADVVLPCAGWSEKEGVYGCSERRYQLDAKVTDPPGEARTDFDILCSLGKRLGFGDLVPWQHPREAWDEIRTVAKETNYRLWGVTRKRLEEEHGVFWPCPTEDHPGTLRRYVKGDDPVVPNDWPTRMCFYGKPNKKAVVWLRPQADPQEVPDSEFPFYYTTGRVIEHWHTGTMTKKCRELVQTKTVSEVEIHPDDAQQLGVRTGDPVKVTSRRGSQVFPANVTDTSPVGMVFVHMHDDERMCNAVTIDAFDPGSKQPEFKICAVKLEKA
jgi:nitrate reductase NapA